MAGASALAIASLAQAQPTLDPQAQLDGASIQTLDAAIAAALVHSPTIVSARSRLDGSEAEVVVSRAAGLPSVDGTVRYSRDLVESQRPGNGLSVDAAVNVPLFQGGSVRNSVRAAQALRDASSLGIGEAEAEVVLAISRAYADVLRDRQIVELNRANVGNLATMLQGLRQRLSARDLTRTDVDQAESRLSLARGRLEMALASLEASEVEFHRLTGSRPGQLAAFPGFAGIPLTADAAVEVAVAENPGIIAARSETQASRFSFNSARGERLPQVFATVNSSYSTSPSYTGPDTREKFGTSVGVAMRMSLFQGGKQGASERIAAAKVTQAEQRLLDLERTVAARTRATYADWLATRAVVEASRDAVRANDKALRGVRLENAVGTRTILEILNAEQELRDAQIQLLNAERDHAVANVAILAAIGKARPGQIELVAAPVVAASVAEQNVPRLVGATPELVALAEVPDMDAGAPNDDLPGRPAVEPEAPLASPAASRHSEQSRTAGPAAAKVPTSGEWAVQLGAFTSLEAARAAFRGASGAAVRRSSGSKPAVFQFDLSGRQLFRTALVAMPDWDHAQTICLKIKAAGQTCLVRRVGQLGKLVWTERNDPAN